jgi:hypothetical protein
MVGSGAFTVNVTLMLVEPVPVPVPLTRRVARYVPTPKFASRGVAVTVSEAVPVVGVVPLVGETESQLLPAVICAVKPRFCPPPETLTVCGAGSVPPAWYVNDSGVAVAVTVAAACTRRVTGIVTTVPPFGVMVTVAVYGIDDGVRLIGATGTTKKVAGVRRVEPFETPGDSQVALLWIVNKTPADPDALVTCRV